MKCQNCDGNGRFEVEDNGVVMQGVYWRCPTCDGKGIVEPLTNEEYIRSCSTEELAILLYKIGFYSNITDDVMNTALMENIPTEEAFELWLKEKHHDK